MKNTEELTLRTAETDDIASIVSLYRQFRPNWKPVADLNERIIAYPAVVAHKNSELVGFAYCYDFAPDILELANIYVAENTRSNSIGTRLLQTVENAIENSQYVGLILSNSDGHRTEQPKRSASTFYLSNGYSEIASTDSTRIFYKNFTT